MHHSIKSRGIMAFGAEENTFFAVVFGEERITSKKPSSSEHDVHRTKTRADMTAPRCLNCREGV
jgi:hypothetical protein